MGFKSFETIRYDHFCTSFISKWNRYCVSSSSSTRLVANIMIKNINVMKYLLFLEEPGQYECYFHFHHFGRRFGHWLGCQLIVDPFDLKGNKSVLETSFTIPFEQSVKNGSPLECAVTNYSDFSKGNTRNRWIKTSVFGKFTLSLLGLTPITKDKYDILEKENVESENILPSDNINLVVRNISRQIEDMKLQDPTDTNCSSDSDNQSILSFNEGTCSRGVPEEFVMVC